MHWPRIVLCMIVNAWGMACVCIVYSHVCMVRAVRVIIGMAGCNVLRVYIVLTSKHICNH